MPALLAVLVALQGGASFSAHAVAELAALRRAVTPAAWLLAHAGDGFVVFRRDSVREGNEGWCARASRATRLPDGTVVARYAYFYPPSPPTSFMLPPMEGSGLIQEQCVLGVIWLQVPAADSQGGAALAIRVRDTLTRIYGAVTPSPDAWDGRTPTDSQRRAFSRLPNAEAIALGIHFFGSAGWRVPGRWQRDSTVVVSAYDAGLGTAKVGRVLALAYLPFAEFGFSHAQLQREAAAERRTTDLAIHAAARSGIDQATTERLLRLLAAAESTYTGRHPSNVIALGSEILAALQAWTGQARELPPPRRAAALLAADQVLGSDAVNYLRAQRPDSGMRQALERVGAHFAYSELGASYNYTHSWLDEALHLDSLGAVGTLATLALLRSGFNRTGMCDGGPDAFRAVIATGERLLASAPNRTTAAEVHRLVGDAYADIVALASGAGLEYVDTATYTAEVPAARRNAVAHYRQALLLDGESPEARAAWLEGWRLLAGLPPSTTHFFCVYD